MDFLKRLPIGQYVDGRSGWLRIIDPRIKLLWMLMFLSTPVLASTVWRISLVIILLFITCFSFLPRRIWVRSLLLLLCFSSFIGLLAIFFPTGETPQILSLRSPQEIPNIIIDGSLWELSFPIKFWNINLGSLLIDRRSAELGIKSATLLFTVIQSVNLTLLTTSSESLIWTIQWFLSPLRPLGLPINRISFQLLLALRFLPLVQEELQNLFRAAATRGINFKNLGIKNSIVILISLLERFLKNILLRAEQGGKAFLVRNGGNIIDSKKFKPSLKISKKTFILNFISGILLLTCFSLRGVYGGI